MTGNREFRVSGQVAEMLLRLGRNIRVARQRRGLTVKELAGRMFVAEKTLRRLEHGAAGVGIGTLAAALWALGLQDQLSDLAAPDNDPVGRFAEEQKERKRVRRKTEAELDF
mgnify:CR=1 FL=1